MRPILTSITFCAAAALNNGLGRTPQMGYNSWYDLKMNPSEAVVRETVDAMVSQGLVALGYTWLNLDDGIVESTRDAAGDLIPDKTGFPNGFAPVAAYIHAHGMQFGVYTDRGPTTCGGRAGAAGHEMQDAAFYARNGITYLKEDSCNAPQDHQTAYAEYSLMRDALNSTGTNFLFSLCGWEAWYAPMCHALGNSCRIGPDDSNWAGVLSDIDAMAPLYPYAGPGGFNDPCLLLGRDSTGVADVSDQQGRFQFSMWATMAAPMLLSSNVRNLTSFQLETYKNTEVIAVGQDPLGRQGQRLVGGPISGGGDGNTPVTTAPCAGGTKAQVWTFVASGATAGYLQAGTGLCADADDCGAPLIAYECVTSGGTCCGASCYDGLKFSLRGDGALTTPGSPGACVTAQGAGVQVQLTPCKTPLALTQVWVHDAASGELTNGGTCLTAGAAGTGANIWGRTLANGDLALTFINAGLVPVDLTCGAACISNITGWEPAQKLAVRDLWQHMDMPATTVAAGLNVTGLEAAGGVSMFRLTPVW